MMVTLYGDGLWRDYETVLVFATPTEELRLCDYSEYGMYAASKMRGCRCLGDMQLRQALTVAEHDEQVSWYGSGMTENGQFGGDYSRAEKHPGYRGDVATVDELRKALQ